MATTTNYGWTTPDDTALVKDGASAIRSLGSSIDSTLKTQIDAQIPDSIIDAKGDLIVGTADNTPARLASSASNGQVLMVDTSTSTGLKWAAIPSSSPANASAVVATSQQTSSSSYTDLTTAGPSVTVTTGTKALVIVSCESIGPDGTGFPYMSYAVSGATTISAADDRAVTIRVPSVNNSTVHASTASRLSTLTAGSNTFTAKYRSSSGTATWQYREIIVIDLGS